MTVDNMDSARRDTSRHFSQKAEYLKDKINEIGANSKHKHIRDMYSGINKFKKGYQTERNLLVRV
jgi:hypothetical protein